ncbi:MAG: DUF1684 domain-containing protein [Bacteroidota bacterium]|nr:DUF1684 domain-containing protein [Bacteroidota bacterium]MDP4191971.1 DUF1684 domain-containing protein [Bacteroidota bacterium]MDP4193589.1 DUF1684 domain-containing protein [Bacteroidota bacterium]
MKKRILFFVILVIAIAVIAIAFVSSRKRYSPEEQAYIKKIEQFRSEKNEEMKNSSDSPFNAKGKIHFENLKYFPVDPSYVFYSKLTEYDKKDTIIIYGTKGEPRKSLRYGYVTIKVDGKNYKVNVYKGYSVHTGEEYYAIWFTDKTTNNETYGVGRYLDFEKNINKDYLYTIDFNKAYNPYCAYSPNYSCAVPTREDYLDIEIKAGEKKFHN